MVNLVAGFTFVEILVVVAVLLIVVGIIASGLSSFRRVADLNYAADAIMADFREARRRTVESYDASSWGVHLEDARAVLFRGNTFVDGTSDNEPFVIASTVEISSISLQGGGQDVLFKRVSGETDQWGTITIVSSSGISRVITVYPSGLAEVQ